MKKNVLGKTGLDVTPLGFGAAPFGYLGEPRKKVERLLIGLLDAGIRLIDTAECYPGSEEAIGEVLGSRRDELVLVSKCGHAVPGASGEEWSPELIGGSVDRSLRQLRTDRLDVLLLHSCGLEKLREGAVIEAVLRARDAGKVRWVGYSGDNEAALFAAGVPEISVIETSVSICDQANIDLVLPAARSRDLGVLAKRPIANAAWRKPSEHRGIYAEYARPYVERFAKMGLRPADLGFPGDPEAAWPEIALRFTLSQPGVSSAIVGTTNVDRLAANLAAVEKGPLPAATVRAIRDAFAGAMASSGESWEGKT